MKVYSSNNFQLDVVQAQDHVDLAHYVTNPALNTIQIPNTINFLNANIPTIFQNQCFNGGNLPFIVEARNTEIGHLFEHLILEYLKIEVEKKYGHATFRGETSWNWTNGDYGKFDIFINSGRKFSPYFSAALTKSIITLEHLFYSNSVVENSTQGGVNPRLVYSHVA